MTNQWLAEGAQMQNGFYWYRETNGDLEVVEVDGCTIWRTGSDVTARMKDWPDNGEFDVLEGTLLNKVPEPENL